MGGMWKVEGGSWLFPSGRQGYKVESGSKEISNTPNIKFMLPNGNCIELPAERLSFTAR